MLSSGPSSVYKLSHTQSLTSGIIEDDTGKVTYSKQRVAVWLWFQVVHVLAVVLVELRQQRDIGRLRKLGFLVDESKDTQRLHCDHVQCFLVVNELYAAPVDRLIVVLLLQSTSSESNQIKSNLRNLLQRPTIRALGRLLQEIKNKNTQ